MSAQLPQPAVHQNHAIAASLMEKTSLLILDSHVDDFEILATGVTPDTEIHILDANRDGVAQITQLLQKRQNIAALHIISHGKPGSVQLGNIWLNQANLETYALQLIQWRASLTHNADILLYGCHIAAEIDPNSETENPFLQQLHHLTGANIAASKTPTGNTALGGDWELEVKIGHITAPLAITPSARQTYQSILTGELIWVKGIGGSSTDNGNSIAVDSSGNTYMTGAFQGTVDFDPGVGTAELTSTGLADIFIAKYDPLGNYLWAKNIGGSNGDIANSIAVDSSGNTYIAGNFQLTVDFDPGVGTAELTFAGANDIFIAKFDTSGNYLWAKNIGSTGNETANNIAVDSSGNTYITGVFSNTVDFDPGAGTAELTSTGLTDIFIAKYDPLGNYLWAKNIGSTGNDQGTSIAVDSSGNTYTTGVFTNTVDFDPGVGTAELTSAGGNDIFIAKYDPLGNYLWAKNIGGSGSDRGRSIAVDSSGNTYITGTFSLTVDFDPSAGTAELTSAGSNNTFITKLDTNGNYVWAKSISSSNDNAGNSIVVDSSGNIYMTGAFQGTADFDPGAGTVNLNSAAGNDIFIAKLDASGNYLWAKNIGGTGSDQGTSIALDSSGNTYTTGVFTNTVDGVAHI